MKAGLPSSWRKETNPQASEVPAETVELNATP